MLTKREYSKIKEICRLTDITVTDIMACVDCYRKLIDDKDYHKARTIKYVLYTIMRQNATDINLVSRIKNAISEMRAFEKLFSYERLESGGDKYAKNNRQQVI
jgi:hypothetical protein